MGRRRAKEEMSNKWLIGGLVVVVALAVGAVVTALVTTRGGLDLFPEDSPEGAVQRYLLAVEKEEYSEAYGYLSSDLQSRCRVEDFAGRSHWPYTEEDQEMTLEKTQTFDGRAVVTATVTVFRPEVPFGASEYSYDRTFNLKLEDGQWRLTVPYAYPWDPYGYCPWF
jgi:hypothetical protein